MSENKRILLIGGAGYIGSHVALALLREGHDVAILDDFSNSAPSVIDRIRQITNREVTLVVGDMCDRPCLAQVFGTNSYDLVILLAGLKSVPESVADPVRYYDVNVGGAVAILQAMQAHGCNELVFSSSATVYGDPEYLPLDEAHPVKPINPYGMTKAVIEGLVRDHSRANPDFSAMILRYFNPVGAHSSGLIGEQPTGEPGNLFPRLAKAYGTGGHATIFGDDFDTPDGTGMRDYIHVDDLAQGHVAACARLGKGDIAPVATVNLGTGTDYSVREIIAAWNTVVGREIPVVMEPRRSGDIDRCWADPTYAAQLLGWRAHRGLSDMCASHWNSYRTLSERLAAAEAGS